MSLQITAILAFDLRGNMSEPDGTCLKTCKSDKQRFKALTSQPKTACIVGERTWECDFNKKQPEGRSFFWFGRGVDPKELLDRIESSGYEKVYIIGGIATYNAFFEHTEFVDYSMIKKMSEHDAKHKNTDLRSYPTIAHDILLNVASKVNPNCVETHWLYDDRSEMIGVSRIVRIVR